MTKKALSISIAFIGVLAFAQTEHVREQARKPPTGLGMKGILEEDEASCQKIIQESFEEFCSWTPSTRFKDSKELRKQYEDDAFVVVSRWRGGADFRNSVTRKKSSVVPKSLSTLLPSTKGHLWVKTVNKQYSAFEKNVEKTYCKDGKPGLNSNFCSSRRGISDFYRASEIAESLSYVFEKIKNKDPTNLSAEAAEKQYAALAVKLQKAYLKLEDERAHTLLRILEAASHNLHSGQTSLSEYKGLKKTYETIDARRNSVGTPRVENYEKPASLSLGLDIEDYDPKSYDVDTVK